MMRFYTNTHRFYCGIDLHTRTLSLCVEGCDPPDRPCVRVPDPRTLGLGLRPGRRNGNNE